MDYLQAIMTNRKAKRMLNEADDWLLFTAKTKDDMTEMGAYLNKPEAWEVLLNLAIDKYHIRETLRNVVNTADEYLENNSDSSES